jgi:anti-anti-sigma regulatory factor
VICGSDSGIKAMHTEAVIAVSRHIGIKPNVSETVFRSTSMPATAEDGVNIDEHESEENPIQAATLVEPARDPNSAGAPLKITGEQTIGTADELHAALTQYLDRGLDVVVDLSEVDECDTAALQLIYALQQSAVQRKQRFHITALSPAITETAAVLGFDIEALTTSRGPAAADGDCEVVVKDNGI